MKNIQDKIEKLEKELAELKQQVSRNNRQTTINSVEDAFGILSPKWCFDGYGEIYEDNCEELFYQECNMTSEKRAKQIKALIQLHLIAEAMNQGAEPIDFYRYFIIKNGIVSQSHFNSSNVKIYPSFNTRELAKEALEKFKDLFNDLYMID